MLATSAREVPHSARASLVSLRGSTLTPSAPTLTRTSPCSTSCMAPLGPFTLTVWPSTLAVTPEGTATGFFPTRDMACSSVSLEYRAEDLPAHIGVAGIVVGHHALGGGQDRHAQAVVDPRQIPHRGIDPPAGLGDPGNLPDHRLAVEIFQLDLELRLPVGMLDRRIAADEAFALEHVKHIDPQPRGRGRDLRLVAHLGIVDARDHVA